MTQISKYKYSQKTSFILLRTLLVFILSSVFTISPVLAADAAKDKKEAPKEIPVVDSKEATVQVELQVPKKKKPALGLEHSTIAPSTSPARVSSEYYSVNPDVKLLIPVHVWGEIKEPGLHYVPIGSTITEAVSASGGPNPLASMPDVEVISKDAKSRDVDLYKTGLTEKVMAHDTIVIERSIRSDLPLIFSAISILVSMGSFVLIASKTFK